MALSPEIAQGFREYDLSSALWEALIAVYKGNEDIKQIRQDMLRQKLNMLNHILGESLEPQLHRFISLTIRTSSARISMPRPEINKKLLNSLHTSWDMNVLVIMKTKDLNRSSLAETTTIIKSYDLDDKQGEIMLD